MARHNSVTINTVWSFVKKGGIWLLNIAIVVYALLAVILIVRGGIGFEFAFAGMNISANDFVKPLVTLFVLLCIRFLIRIETKNLVLLAASLFFTLGFVEIGLRIIAPPLAAQPSLQQMVQPSEILGYSLVPGLTGKGRIGENIVINSKGLRDVERPLEKPEGTFRILGIGDSFTFGIGVDLEQTYLKVLEEMLNSTSDQPHFDVINSGVAGYNLYQAKTYLKEKGLAYDPDMVIYFFFLDDVGGLSSSEEARDRYLQDTAQWDQHNQDNALWQFSYAANFVYNLGTIVSGRIRSYHTAPWLRTIEQRKQALYDTRWGPTIRAEVDLGPFEKHLQELKAVCIRNNIRLLTVIIPDALQVGNPDMQVINRVFQKMCLKHDIPVLDITPIFEQEMDINTLYLFPLDAHTSPKGNRIIAAAVFDALRRMLDLESSM